MDIFRLLRLTFQATFLTSFEFITPSISTQRQRQTFSLQYIHLKYNSNLLYHGCIPMDKNGNFIKIKLNNEYYSGKALLETQDTS